MSGQAMTSWRVPIVLAENATYYWSVRARDGAGEDRASPWTPAIALFVDTANESPATPHALRPVDGVSVTTRSPELAASTVTPGSTAAEASRTTPAIVAWANARLGKSSVPATTARTRRCTRMENLLEPMTVFAEGSTPPKLD